MAESAEHSMQLRIEEFEELQRTGLLTERELSDMKKKRRDFEYKLRAVTRDLNCYMNYIEYEEKMLRLIRCRRDQNKISAKKGSIEYRMITKIKKLYEDALRFAPDNYDVCVNYFLFCKRVKYIEPATAAVDRLLKLHPGREHSWHLAANWYAKGQKNFKYCLEILLKGLVLHPDSELLYKQTIHFQLSKAQLVISQCEKETPDELENKKKLFVEKLNYFIDMVFKNIKKFCFYFELLDILENYDFVGEIKKRILDKIMEEHAQEPLVWHNLAQRCQRGLDEDSEVGTEVEGVEKRLKSCIAKYLEGLSKIPQNRKPHLWSLFLDYLIQSYERKKVSVDDLNEYLSKAHDCRCLPEKYYDYWLALNKNDFSGEILKKATEAYPRSEKWYELLLKYKILKHYSTENITVTFSQGKEALGDRAVNLWTTFIQYHIVTSPDDVVQSYFLKGIKESDKISLALRPQYLEWLRLTKGITETRKAYTELCNARPFCKSLHLTMLNVASADCDRDEMERIHKTLTEQFPGDLDVWVELMEFYVHYRRHDPPEKRSADRNRTYNKALCMLSEPLQKQFKEKCSQHVLSSTFE